MPPNYGKNCLQLSSPEDHPFLLPSHPYCLAIQSLVFIVMYKEHKSYEVFIFHKSILAVASQRLA